MDREEVSGLTILNYYKYSYCVHCYAEIEDKKEHNENNIKKVAQLVAATIPAITGVVLKFIKRGR